MESSLILGFLVSAILYSGPLLFGTLGEILSEKVGNLNLGVEGMMYLGAIFGFLAGYSTGSAALTLLAAFGAGALAALIYAFLTVTLKADQIVSGLTLTIFGTGAANFIGDAVIRNAPNNNAELAAGIKTVFANFDLPLLSQIPFIGKLLFSHNILIYLGVILCVAVGLYLNHTRVGLNLRAVGENAQAADAAGVPVTLYKYLSIMTGGGICGLGGIYIILSICGGKWVFNAVNGMGWIAVALVIFASWSPYRAIFGSVVFGALRILMFYIPKSVVNIPSAVFSMVPFLVTAIVIIVSSMGQKKKKAEPKGLGVNYIREER